MAIHNEAIVVGAGLSGLTAAHELSHLGVDTLVLEKAPHTGGADRSLTDPWGNLFDNGCHILDHGRSVVTSAFFQRVLHGNVRRFALRRGLVLGNSLFPYNAPLAEWPPELRGLFDTPPREDDIVGELRPERWVRFLRGERVFRR